jgi:hypothetical protein
VRLPPPRDLAQSDSKLKKGKKKKKVRADAWQALRCDALSSLPVPCACCTKHLPTHPPAHRPHPHSLTHPPTQEKKKARKEEKKRKEKKRKKDEKPAKKAKKEKKAKKAKKEA